MNILQSLNFSFILLLTLLLTSCSLLEGTKQVANNEYLGINQSEIEQKLTKNTSLEDQNITLTSSLLTTAQHLQQLQQELHQINDQIETIQNNINSLQNQSNQSEIITYLNTLNQLTEQSKAFVVSLHQSTVVWDSYLSTAINNKDSLNFSQPVNQTVFVDSITKPLESFKKI
jgi:septal ring factor EnvC (AmiA/AmiB activator)